MNITTGAVSCDAALKFAAELEVAIGEVANRKRKADRIPLEPMARLIQFARDGAAEIDRLRAELKSKDERIVAIVEDAQQRERYLRSYMR